MSASLVQHHVSCLYTVEASVFFRLLKLNFTHFSSVLWCFKDGDVGLSTTLLYINNYGMDYKEILYIHVPQRINPTDCSQGFHLVPFN